MDLLDRIAYDTGGFTVQEILSSFCKKILEIVDLVNKNEEVCDEAHTLIENIRNEVVPVLVDDTIKELEDNGYFNELVNVTLFEQLRTNLTTLLNDAITDNTTRLDNFNSQLVTKASKEETQNIQQQVNNLVLASDGTQNAEVVQSRGSYSALNDRLTDYDYKIKGLINNNNIFENYSVQNSSKWQYITKPFNVVDGTEICNALMFDVSTGEMPFLYQDISTDKFNGDGKYIISFKTKCGTTTNSSISVSVIGYPTSANSGGTQLFTKNNFNAWVINSSEWQETSVEMELSGISSYHHLRVLIQMRNDARKYYFSELYLGKKGVNNTYSYYNNQLQIIKNEINSLKPTLLTKSLYINGDSISFGEGYEGGYGKILADKYNFYVSNNAVSGGTLASGTTYSDGSPRHYINESVVNKFIPGFDYAIFSGGFNDYGNNVPLGKLSDSEFCFTNEVDNNTVIGALETMFRYAIKTSPSTQLYFLITHKVNRCATTQNTLGLTMQDYVNAIKLVCERYSVPIINCWEKSRLITVYDELKIYTDNEDRVHPNKEGYDIFYLPVIEQEMRLS